MADALPYDGRIAARIKKLTAAGVSRHATLEAIQGYQNAPRSLQTMYKLYRDDMAEAAANIAEQIGSKVIEQAINGDFPSQKLFLETKGGWSKTEVQVNVDVDSKDVDESALDKLMGLLGKTDIEPKE